MNYGELVQEAKRACEKSYSPYSGCAVGAALLCTDGSVYLGCNIENASFSPTVCAERTAIFKAVSEGKRDFTAIAVYAEKQGRIINNFTPCGVCRQIMREFCKNDFVILVASEAGYDTYTLDELLPHSFGGDRVI